MQNLPRQRDRERGRGGSAGGAKMEHDLLVARAALGESLAAFASPEDIVLLKLLRYSEQDRVDIRVLAERNRLDR